MAELPVLVDVGVSNLDVLPCCGVKRAGHEGRERKNCWIRAHLKVGLCAKVALGADDRQCGYVEYLPGEYAWRGVDARGWMFLNCIFTFWREYQHKGLGAAMVEACLSDARKAGMNGVAVLTRKGPWLAGSELFLSNGFEAVAEAAPDYQLLVKRLKKRAANPVFCGNFERKMKRYGKGLTMIVSDQCPHIAKFASEIAASAKADYGLEPEVVRLETHLEAQDAPTPFAVFAMVLDGRLIADHQISRTRFHNIMRKLGFRAG